MVLGRTKAEAELQPKDEPDLEQEIPASTPNATPTNSAPHSSTITNIDDLTPNEINLLVLHNFNSSDVSMKQLKILARNNLKKLSVRLYPRQYSQTL